MTEITLLIYSSIHAKIPTVILTIASDLFRTCVIIVHTILCVFGLLFCYFKESKRQNKMDHKILRLHIWILVLLYWCAVCGMAEEDYIIDPHDMINPRKPILKVNNSISSPKNNKNTNKTKNTTIKNCKIIAECQLLLFFLTRHFNINQVRGLYYLLFS